MKFHNGDPFTAEDVKFSFQRARAKILHEKVREVVIVDPYPFDEDRISVSATARVIPDRRYASTEEGRDAVAGAESVQIGAELRRN